MSLEKRIERGDRIKAFLEDPHVMQVFEAITVECFKDWLSLPRDQADLVRLKARAAQDVLDAFTKVRDDGMLARKELEELARQSHKQRYT